MSTGGFGLRLRAAAMGISVALLAATPAEADRPARALVAPDRSGHLLDRPFPSDELLTAQGTVDLASFPRVATPLGQLFLDGWIDQARQVAAGFSALGPIYFRLDRDPGLASRYEGRPSDPVQLRSLDSGHRVPIRVRFVADSRGDPYLPDGTLVVSPDEAHPLRGGERYAAWLHRSVASPPPGWRPPAELRRRGVAVATVFTVQDGPGQLVSLRRTVEAALAVDPSLTSPTAPLREVVSLHYAPGVTPSGAAATVETVRFADGGQQQTFLDDSPFPARTLDLRGGPTRVFQTEILTLAFQDPEGRPYQSPGLGIVTDTTRSDGWIPFHPDGSVAVEPQPEPVRVTVQQPRHRPTRAVVVWGHGSGGDAYESVGRADPANDLLSIRERLADAGVAIVGFDQPLFGRRFDLIDRGYIDTLAVVNVPNLPAFRANVQQGAVDLYLTGLFARRTVPALLGLDAEMELPLGVFGHSIGAQIAAVGLGMNGAEAPAAALLNGTGGFLTHSVLASDLLSLEGETAALIFSLAGLEPRPDASAAEALGALFGVPEAAFGGIDRHHPLSLPFQLVIDGADPLPIASSHAVPVEVFLGEGDSRVPVEGAEWIAAAAPAGSFVSCRPRSDYDGHFCIFREPEGLEAFTRLSGGL